MAFKSGKSKWELSKWGFWHLSTIAYNCHFAMKIPLRKSTIVLTIVRKLQRVALNPHAREPFHKHLPD